MAFFSSSSSGQQKIIGFDVLFNPDYQIDVLQLLIAACKKKEFAILWPGTYSDGKLMYAETDYSDFKIYDLDKYDVTCIV